MIPIKELKSLAEQETLTDPESKKLLHWFLFIHTNIALNFEHVPITDRESYDKRLEYVKAYFKSFVID